MQRKQAEDLWNAIEQHGKALQDVEALDNGNCMLTEHSRDEVRRWLGIRQMALESLFLATTGFAPFLPESGRPDAEEPQPEYVIRNKRNFLFWSNDWGWGSFPGCERYRDMSWDLPADGEWYPVDKCGWQVELRSILDCLDVAGFDTWVPARLEHVLDIYGEEE